ncbi:delta-60 repeat domain-containing protein [Actinomadura chokoriensis]|uniref:delta-60 repeat domain-containing protein n=1 Tax=Actinomadura chokoriensis TaxID=454156 RepID=UPI0031F8E81B
MSRLRRSTAVAVTAVTGIGLVAAPQFAGDREVPVVASAAQTAGKMPAETPYGGTPNIEPNQGGWAGIVYAMTKVGDKIFVGGKFKSVKQGDTTYPVTNLIAINASNKHLDTAFKPQLDGDVLALAPGADGKSVVVGGKFNTVNGNARPKLARLDASTGKELANGTWKTPGVKGGAVYDIEEAHGRLYIAGEFTTVAGVKRNRLAALSPTTGGLSTKFGMVPFAGVHNGGTSRVRRIAATPDGTKMYAIGNFRTAGGEERRQFARLDLGDSSDALDTTWKTSGFATSCNTVFDSYLRDLAMSPDGKFVVVGATGGPYGTAQLCDSVTRWDTASSGSDVKPAWVNWTGGDTIDSVAVSGAAVFAGGHPRWSNNPNGRDTAGPGAVTRPGLAALDPANGVPFSWNPGRDPRGDGAWSLLVTSEGLWVGSDTNYFLPPSSHKFRGKIGYFPFEGGKTLPEDTTAQLPGKVYIAAPGSLVQPNKLVSRTFDGTTAGTETTETVAGGMDWSDVRGTMLINGVLWYAKADGKLYKRAFNGTTVGAEELVNPYANPAWDADEPGWKGRAPEFYSSLQGGRTLGMFYDNGRMYYTRSGSSALYYRYFTPESGILGAIEYTAASSGWSNVRGMFVSGDKLYYVASDGKLMAVKFADGAPSGSPTVVSSDDWRGRGLFVG